MVDYVINWGDINGEEAVSIVTNTNIGGLFIYKAIIDKEKWVLINFFDTDTDATTNVWSYSMDENTWIIDEANKEWGHNKGAILGNQYCPTSVKGQTTARTNCNTFAGEATMYNP